VNVALVQGHRSLPGGSSIAKLLLQHRGRRHIGLLPDYSAKQILAWADSHHQRTGAWPSCLDGAIANVPGETWKAVQTALSSGGRGQPGGSSLARLLSRCRGVPNVMDLPPITVEQILTWADAFNECMGRWPKLTDGHVSGQSALTWSGLNVALTQGNRGLPGGSSLMKLLQKHRGRRHKRILPRYTIRQILAWADEHHQRTGAWPSCYAGPIAGAPGETWRAVESALTNGRRGLPGGSSLAGLLRMRRGARRHRPWAG
jgi:hypothetical protein